MRRDIYPADMTDAEWRILKPLVPPAKPGGRPASIPAGRDWWQKRRVGRRYECRLHSIAPATPSPAFRCLS